MPPIFSFTPALLQAWPRRAGERKNGRLWFKNCTNFMNHSSTFKKTPRRAFNLVIRIRPELSCLPQHAKRGHAKSSSPPKVSAVIALQRWEIAFPHPSIAVHRPDLRNSCSSLAVAVFQAPFGCSCFSPRHSKVFWMHSKSAV